MSSPTPTPTPTPNATLLDFTTTPLSKHYGHPNHYALIIDNLLTPAECHALTALAESHSTASWQPAAIKKGAARQEVETDVRDCARILLDDAATAEMLYQRIRPFLAPVWEIGGGATGVVAGTWRRGRGRSWRMAGVNERLRFLRYGEGQFFQAHCDAAYVRAGGRERSFLTVHVYLNSEGEGGECRGGATRFWGMNMKEFVDVEARVGRVLVFQQRGLLHSGEVVEEGVKRTLRSDVMYEAVDVGEGSGEMVKEESK